jgi:hypothetical protein
MGITDTQSYSLVVRDAFHDGIKADPFFTGYTVRKSKMLTVQRDLLPYLGVYIVDEVMTPDGDADAGDIRFIHNLRIGFSGVVANNDQVAAELQIDAIYWRIMNDFWPNADFMNVLVSSMPDNVRLEGVTRGLRRHNWGSSQLNNQTPFAELQYEATVIYRTNWPPIITDDLLEIDVTTGLKPGDTPEEMARRLQAHVKYIFTPGQTARGPIKRPLSRRLATPEKDQANG